MGKIIRKKGGVRMFRLPASIPKRRARAMAWGLSVFAVLAVLLGFWYFENWTIQTQTFVLRQAALPDAFDGFRIVEIADLHGRQFGRDNAELLQAVRAARPDLIAIDGDLVDERTELSMLEPLLRGLCAIAPTYYVTGNHEWARSDTRALLHRIEDCGVTVLANEYCVLRRGEDKLVLAGVHDPNGPADQKTPEALLAEIRQKEGAQSYVLLLAHRNGQLAQWAELGVQTVLTGHCHGGVVRLPYLGGVFGSGGSLFPKYSAGVYRMGGTEMVVSRGLGNTRAICRVFNRPHLPVILLQKP